jgi:dihydroneopterin aldolase
MLSINLNNLSFYSFHGLHEHERITGNSFIVNVTIKYLPLSIVKTIDQTIDYVNIYELIKQRMAVATPLLETVVMEIANEIISKYEQVTEVDISLTKENPPIPDFEGSVGVSYNLKIK